MPHTEDHHSRHENGGLDEISVAGLSGVLADAQTPIAHASTHEGGSDPISPAGIGAEPAFSKNTAFNKDFGSGSGTVCEGNDARLGYWGRAVNVLSPGNAGDIVSIAGVNGTDPLLEISQTPTGTTTNALVDLRALGTNWGAGSTILNIVTEDDDATPLVIGDGVSNTFIVKRDGTLGVGMTPAGSGYRIQVAGGHIVATGTYGTMSYGVGVPGDTDVEWIRTYHNGASGAFVEVNKGGTGSYRALNLTVAGAARLQVETDGTLNVAGTTDYETLVTADDDLPNKKYVDDAISTGVGAVTFWDRNLGVLTPHYAGDIVSIPATDGTTEILNITQTPTTGTTNVVAYFEADGTNWNSGSAVVKIVSDDDSAWPLHVYDGSQDVFVLTRGGDVAMLGNLQMVGGGTIATTAAGDIGLDPDTTGAVRFTATANVVAESYTDTSGTVWSIKVTPGSAGSATIMKLDASGANWATGGRVLQLEADDVDVIPLVVTDGGTQRFSITNSGVVRWGANVAAGSLDHSGYLSWDTNKVMIGGADADTELALYASAGEKVRVNASGQVGIGIFSSIQAKLDIKSSGTGTSPFRIERSANANNLAYIFEDGDGDAIFYLYDKDNALGVRLDSALGDSYILDGKFGLGTAAPGLRLDVHVDSDTQYLASSVPTTQGARIYNVGDGAQDQAFSSLTLLASQDSGSTYGGAVFNAIQRLDTASGTDLAIQLRNDSAAWFEVARFTEDGYFGVGTNAPYWETEIIEFGNAITGTSVDISELGFVIHRDNDTNNHAVGLGFGHSTTDGTVGAAIIHERTDSYSKGKLHIATKSDTANGTDLPIRMTVAEDGDIGFGTTSPPAGSTATVGSTGRYLSMYYATLPVAFEIASNTDTDGTLIGVLQFSNVANADYANNDADGRIIAQITSEIYTTDGNAGNDSGGHLVFYTKPEAASLTEAMRINPSRTVLIGTGTPQVVNTAGELFVTGRLEVATEIHTENVHIRDLGLATYGRFQFVVDDGLHLGIGNNDGYANRNFILVDYANISDDYDHQPASANPTFIMHSATAAATATDQYLWQRHNSSGGEIGTGVGYLQLVPASYVRVGSGTPTTAYGAGDAYVTSELEVAGTVYTPTITSVVATGYLAVAGLNGANIELYGGSHATLANQAFYDASAHTWRNQAGSSTWMSINNLGLVKVGTGTSVHGLAGVGDLLVSDQFEVVADSFLRGTVNHTNGTDSWVLEKTGANTTTLTAVLENWSVTTNKTGTINIGTLLDVDASNINIDATTELLIYNATTGSGGGTYVQGVQIYDDESPLYKVIEWDVNSASDGHLTINAINSNTGSADLRLDADGTIYLYGSAVEFTSMTTFDSDTIVADAATLFFGDSYDACLAYDLTQTPDSLVLGLGADSRSLVVARTADILGSVDFAHALQTHPTIFVQSNYASADIAEYLLIRYDRIEGATKVSDTATYTTTIKGVSAYASAAVNQDGGDLVLSGGDKASGGGANGVVSFATDALVGDDIQLLFGSLPDAAIQYDTGQTNDSLMLGLAATSNSLIVCEYADIAFNFAHTVQTHPTIFVQSTNQSTDQYIGITYTEIYTGQTAGGLTISAASGANLHLYAQSHATLPYQAFVDANTTTIRNAAGSTTSVVVTPGSSVKVSDPFYIGSTYYLDDSSDLLQMSFTTLCRNEDTSWIYLSGGNTSSSGANIQLYGGAHGSFPDYAYYAAGVHTFRDEDDANTSLVITPGTSIVVSDPLIVDDYAQFYDNRTLYFGTAVQAGIQFDTDEVTANTLKIGVDGTSKTLIVTDINNINKSHDHAASSNPTLFIHSATDPDTANTQWLGFSHQTTYGYITTGVGSLVLNPVDSVTIGNAGSTSHSLGNDDLFCSADLEVDGTTYFDGAVGFYSNATFSDDAKFNSDYQLRFGTAPNCAIEYDTTGGTDSLRIGVDNTTKLLVVCDYADMAEDFGLSAMSHPTLVVHDASTTDANFFAVQHDGTDYGTAVGAGGSYTNHMSPVSLADEAYFNLPIGAAGWMNFIVGDGDAWGYVIFQTDGTVTLGAVSSNVANTETDGYFCVYDGGSAVTVKNKLGTTKKVVYDYHYTTSPT